MSSPRIGAQFAEQTDAVEMRHHHVAQHEIRWIGARGLQGGLPVGKRVHFATLA